jgi:Xaa-Pro dipeptidase
MERPTLLIVSKTCRPIAILPVLEVESFAQLNIDADIVEWQDSDGYQSAFDKGFNKLGSISKIGVEGQRMRVFEMQAIEKSLPNITIVNAQKLISKMRLIKDHQEIEHLRQAVKIAESALTDTIKFVTVNKTEIEIKNFLIQQLYQHGAEDIAFDPIVLAAENSALPHGHSRNDYHISEDDCLLFDFGATVNGYHSDITRTFFVGSASDEYKNIYAAVLKANQIGKKISKPKLTLHDLDDQVLNSLCDSGYEDLIVHKTGHGLGMDVHEDPYVMRNNQEVLEAGMVITIEPGLYKQGSLGVRIEDNILITDSGCESLTSFSRDLTVI